MLKFFHEIKVTKPGGCNFERSLRCHLDPLRELGFIVKECESYILIQHGTYIKEKNFILDTLHYDMVGYTVTIILAALIKKSHIKIINYALEPEILDILDYIEKAGIEINRSNQTLEIINYEHKTDNIEHTIIPDRIETASFIAIMTVLPKNSTLILENIDLVSIESYLNIYKKIQIDCKYNHKNTLIVKNHNKLFHGVHITANNFPGFSTDLQPFTASALCFVEEESSIIDNVFPNRFEYVKTLNRAHANIKLENIVLEGKEHKKAWIKKQTLKPSELRCLDLRAGMSCVLLGLGIEEPIRIQNAFQLFRGYEDFIFKFKNIGIELLSNYENTYFID